MESERPSTLTALASRPSSDIEATGIEGAILRFHSGEEEGQVKKLLEDCCDPGQFFAMTKENSPVGKNLWFDGEFLYSFTIDNKTFSLFPKATPFQLPLKKCSVVGNGGILKRSGCGRQIDQADFVMRCNLPPLSSRYSQDVGSKTQLVTANPSIIQKR
ncbi:PREDICTED: alpha-N-acetylneuraminide alpha-2,8-sialyltransferase [Gekko japonicus]|uniref:Alpha-N-acetylneuraminide alpha-2,8-sialyltransferase n=1 Tax=Gekko japonicus TaxID=146911 RepID=A0ABM1KE16_GEKJA|nr:PREDICTED: alpha-N-acetylneuraminide alpha-2,8-sialyltransferase [Gekko japonicus]